MVSISFDQDLCPEEIYLNFYLRQTLSTINRKGALKGAYLIQFLSFYFVPKKKVIRTP